MTNYVKSNRLHARSWIALSLLGGLALNANAAIEQIYNWNGLEFVRSGNAHHVHPASPESTRLRGGWVLEISDVEPKATAKHDLPYANKGGALAKVTVTPSIDPKKVSARVVQGLKNAAAGAATGNGYVAIGALACGLLDCGAAAVALAEWGIDQLKKNDDGSLSVNQPDSTGAYQSTGTSYRANIYGGSGVFYSPAEACKGIGMGLVYTGHTMTGTYSGYCHMTDGGRPYGADGKTGFTGSPAPSCPYGQWVKNGVCGANLPTVETPLQTYLDSRYTGKGWDNHWAKMTAGIIAAKGNVFTDGTSVGITGPAIVPISTSTTKTPVNLVPGTTNPAPSGHTGPTDSGTRTTTSTTSGINTFNPAPFSSPGSSGSSGGTSGGPSISTGQKTETTTNITNNITNNTSTTVTTNITETDDAPKEEEKDFCEKNPDALACAEADTPEQDIPRDKVTISYEYADIFGNGACPADSYLNTHGQTLKVWDWQASCDHIQDYFRPVLIACCAFAAFVIISAGVKE